MRAIILTKARREICLYGILNSNNVGSTPFFEFIFMYYNPIIGIQGWGS